MTEANSDLAGPSAMLDRRAFISTLSLLMTTTLPLASALASNRPNAGDSADLVAQLTDPAAAAHLGRLYLLRNPGERDPARLIEALGRALAALPHKPPATTSPPGLHGSVNALILAEYQNEPLMAIDGWLLAPSEARLYALCALLLPADAGFQLAGSTSLPRPRQ